MVGLRSSSSVAVGSWKLLEAQDQGKGTLAELADRVRRVKMKGSEVVHLEWPAW